MDAVLAGDCRWWSLQETGSINVDSYLIDQRHELVKLAALIDWQAFADEWSSQFESTTGGGAAVPSSTSTRSVLAALQRRAVLPPRTAM